MSLNLFQNILHRKTKLTFKKWYVMQLKLG